MLLCTVISGAATAGAAFAYRCEGPQGVHVGKFSVGGGFMFGEVTGWCLSRNELVHVSWRTSYRVGERKPVPPKRTNVFDPRTGETLELVHVKECKEPIVPIETEEQLARIPPCAGATMTISDRLEYD
jgi:hypothetical protein